jgi:hypothetical protein
MDFNLEKVPSWASTWCYYFAAIGIASILVGFIGLFTMKRTSVAMTLLFLTAALVQAATAMTLFWMCRSSLPAPARSVSVSLPNISFGTPRGDATAPAGKWLATDVNPDYRGELASQFSG